jgi:hypothetical protein
MGVAAGVKDLAMLNIELNPVVTASVVVLDKTTPCPRLRTLSNLLSKNSHVASLS